MEIEVLYTSRQSFHKMHIVLNTCINPAFPISRERVPAIILIGHHPVHYRVTVFIGYYTR